MSQNYDYLLLQAHQEVLNLPGGGHAASLLSDLQQMAMPKSAGYKISLRVILLYTVNMILIVALVFGMAGYRVSSMFSERLLETEYYRGVYDTCAAFSTRIFGMDRASAVIQCSEFIVIVRIEQDWYNTTSDGFSFSP